MQGIQGPVRAQAGDMAGLRDALADGLREHPAGVPSAEAREGRRLLGVNPGVGCHDLEERRQAFRNHDGGSHTFFLSENQSKRR